MKKFIIAILAALMLTGCAENTEKPIVNANDNINSVFENSTSSEVNSTVENTTSVENIFSSKSEPVESVETENTSSDNISAVEDNTTYSQSSSTGKSEETVISTPVSSIAGSTIESKPVSSSSSTSSSAKPVQSSSSISSSSKPVQSSSSISTVQSSTQYSSSKPAEKPAETTPKHNCSTDGHIWKITYTTTEPKWCYDYHLIQYFGFDYDAAWDHFGTDVDVNQIFLDNMAALGIDADTGNSTYEVKVWGTETTQRDTCTICGAIYEHSSTINPLGEWQFKNDHNPSDHFPETNFDTLFWDPYNVPQVVIDNIRLYWELVYEMLY